MGGAHGWFCVEDSSSKSDPDPYSSLEVVGWGVGAASEVGAVGGLLMAMDDDDGGYTNKKRRVSESL